MIKENIIKQLDILIKDWGILRRWNSHWQTLSQEHEQKCEWFLSRVYSFITQYLPSKNWYYISSINIIDQWHWFNIPQTVWNLVEILEWLKYDVENWFLQWFESQISAEIFDTFLDHWESYLKNDMKDQAGVIIGITFEDTVRKLGRLNGIEEKNLEDVINKLQSSSIFTGIETKRAKVCSALRTSAAHARWEEFQKSDVETTLVFTRELISKVDSTL